MRRTESMPSENHPTSVKATLFDPGALDSIFSQTAFMSGAGDERMARCPGMSQQDAVDARPGEVSPSAESQFLPEQRRLRVRQDTTDSVEGGFVVQPDAAAAAEAPLDAASMDMTPAVLPATERRGKNEVDVAACGIPLEVRRFQCTKSTLALKEATKNDATLLSTKLVDYIVSLTFGDTMMLTEKEMCEWLVAQLCDRIETGQMWVVAKTYVLVSALLWRGSHTFVMLMHERGKSVFYATRIADTLASVVQLNVSGESGKGEIPAPKGTKPERSTRSASKKGSTTVSTPAPAVTDGARSAIPEDELAFLFSNTAYIESLCEYRARHPTMDLAHGEILTAAGDAAQRGQTAASWKELLDDTLELMKAITLTDPHGEICLIAQAVATLRVRDAVLLYQIACRTLVRLLYYVTSTFAIFLDALEVGLLSSKPSPSPSSGSPTGGAAVAGMPSREPSLFLDLTTTAGGNHDVTPQEMEDMMQGYYHAIYQFNRTVILIRDYCATVDYVDKAVAQRAMAALVPLPEAYVQEFHDLRKFFTSSACPVNMVKLHRAAKESAQLQRAEEQSDTASLHLDVVAGDPNSTASMSAARSPLTQADIRQSLLDFIGFQVANQSTREQLWTHQVQALCSLFDAKEAAVLKDIFTSGLEGLKHKWREFTNNGAAAAEKAMHLPSDSNSFTIQVESSNLQGMSSSDAAASASSRTSTFILRSLPPGGVRVGSNGRPDLISLNATHLTSENSIDAMLQSDDVVVICNEECSCNDSLKLVDRFQVLMDVPLGEGSYGKVYRAWDEMIGCYLAAKELPLDASKSHKVAVREVLQEYTVLTELSHPNIVRVVAFMVLKQTARIYMEWMPSGSLQDVLHHHPRGVLRESVVRRYARDVLSGLAFLHSRGVIHRDVKPGNMLLSSEGAVKLTDFGTSLVLSGNNHTLESDAITGTVAYMAPESVQGTYSSASDIWSFGCSILHLVTGNVPWYNPSTQSSPEPIALLFKIGSLDDATHLERPHNALKAAAKAAKATAHQEGEACVTIVASPTSKEVSGADPTVKAAAPQSKNQMVSVGAELLDMLDAIFVADRKKRPSAGELLHYPFLRESVSSM